MYTQTDTSANSADPDETAHVYTVCVSVFDFEGYPISQQRTFPKLEEERIHFFVLCPLMQFDEVQTEARQSIVITWSYLE